MVTVPSTEDVVAEAETAAEEDDAFTVLKNPVLLKFVEDRTSKYLL
jgi:hypothetical protein